MSPPSCGFSTLMTSAPWSARNIVPKGPAPYCSIARTRTPASGSMTRASCNRHRKEPADAARSRKRSRRMPLHELARDDDALQLVRTFADREERRVAVVALEVELLRIAVGAVD